MYYSRERFGTRAEDAPARGENPGKLRAQVVVREPLNAPELWVLKQISDLDTDLSVNIRDDLGAKKKTEKLGDYCPTSISRRQAQELDRLFDGEYLRAWWRSVWFETAERNALSGDGRLQPQVLVFLQERCAGYPVGTPPKFGILSIEIKKGPSLETILGEVWWQRAGEAGVWPIVPQLAPGETAEILILKTTVESTASLLRILEFLRDSGELLQSSKNNPDVRALIRSLGSRTV